MSNWKVVRPIGRTNYSRNPQFRYDVTFGWEFSQSGSGGYRVLNNNSQWVGPRSANIYTGSGTATMRGAHSVSIDHQHTAYVSARVRSGIGNQVRISVYDGSTMRASETYTLEHSGWTRVETQWRNTTGSAVSVTIQVEFLSSTTLYGLDATQLETDWIAAGSVNDRPTTYIDGDQEGCWWHGGPHLSASGRSAASRAGGVVLDLKDDLRFGVDTIVEAGPPPVTHHVHEYAIRPGGEVSGQKVHLRTFGLTGTLRDWSGEDDNLHVTRKRLTDLLVPWAYPKERGEYQPVKLIYSGAGEEKYIRAHYEHPSLSGSLGLDTVFGQYEKLTLRWMSEDPFWYSERQKGARLLVNNSFTMRMFASRTRADGGWTNMGVDSSVVVGQIQAMEYNPIDGKIYVGGFFEGLNGVAGRDFLARYDPASAQWETVGSAGEINAAVRCIDFAPNGDVYFGGDFTNAGDTSGDYVAYYSLENDDIFSVQGGGTGMVRDLLVMPGSRDLWLTGEFTGWAGLLNADYLVRYDRANLSWDDTAGALSTVGWELDRDSRGRIYVVGNFATPVSRIGYWDPETTSWTDLGADLVGTAFLVSLKVAPDDRVYAGFDITGGARRGLSVWDGESWETLGRVALLDGSVGEVWRIHIAPDGAVIIGGGFRQIVRNDRYVISDTGISMARWDGAAWHRFDLSGYDGEDYTNTYAFVTTNQDPVLPHLYDVWVGSGETSLGTVRHGTVVPVTNSGNAPALPSFAFRNTGSDPVTVASIRNNTTGREVQLDLELTPDEEVRVEFRNTGVRIRSNIRGILPFALRPGVSPDAMALIPGRNDLVAFVFGDGAIGASSFVWWSDTHSGID